jgi:hypothetical protein
LELEEMRRRDLFLTAGVLPLAAACGPLKGGTARPSERPIPDANVNPWGANVFLHKEVEAWKKEKTLEMAREAGIAWLKQHFPWEEIEQPSKGKFFDERWKKPTWQKFDELVELAEKYKLKLIVRLDRPPAWAKQNNAHPEAPPDRLEDYGDFVAAVAARYKGRIFHYQVWNEPNLASEWRESPNPPEYVEMLRIGYTRLKEVDPQIRVLSAPLAITLERSPRALVELEFLDEMYKAGAKEFFDIMSANAYGLEYPPTAEPDPKVLNFRRVELLRQVMEKHGDTQKAVWFNEYGWNASPEDMDPKKLIWRRVTEKQQADWTVEGVTYARKHWPWAGVICIWYLRQVGDIPPTSSEYYFRMIDPDFTPRLVYKSVQKASKQVT